MKQFFTYQTLLLSTVYLLLISLFSANVASYHSWLIKADSEFIELYSCNSVEFEEKENNNDQDDKTRMGLFYSKASLSESIVQLFYLNDFLSHHYPEIIIPPPEYFLS